MKKKELKEQIRDLKERVSDLERKMSGLARSMNNLRPRLYKTTIVRQNLGEQPDVS